MYEELRQLIKDSDKIVFFGGAGVSTESGLLDFRSETGLYRAVQSYGYPPEALLSHTFFMKNPAIFFAYYKENLLCPEAEPNRAHRALAKLEQEGKLLSVVTQNIDGLHQKAGSKRVHELHGSVMRNYCINCGASYDLDYILQEDHCGGEKDGIPICSACGGTVKPDVVLYEEMLNDDVMRAAIDDIGKADVMIVGGTSLAVYPAAGLLNYFRGNRVVLINKSETPYDRNADMVIHEKIGTVLGEACDI